MNWSARSGELVSAGSGMPQGLVVPAMENAPKPPDGSFASVLLVTDLPTAHQSVGYRFNDEGIFEEVVRVNREARFDVQFYRELAVESALRLSSWNESFWALEQQRARYVLFNIGPVKTMIDEVSGAYEERAMVDLTVDYFTVSVYSEGHVDTMGDITAYVGDTGSTEVFEHQINDGAC